MNEENELRNISFSEHLMPKEEMLEIKMKKSSLTIGIPKEDIRFENRVCLVPDAVHVLVLNGHRVLIENEAGQAANFSNKDYSEAGGEIVYSSEAVFKADIIIKVAPLSKTERSYLRAKQIVMSSLHLAGQELNYFNDLIKKKVTAIAFEQIKDKSGAYPVIRSMSKIVGNTAIFIAAEYLSNPRFGVGKMFGGFPGIIPTEVIILGAGNISENAARAAIGMGAMVKVFDNSIYKLERLQNNLNNRIFTSIIQPKTLMNHLKTADVVIGAIHTSKGFSPCVVSEDMVKCMKEGSLIVDLSIDQGGCFETSELTTHKQPLFVKYGIPHYCVPNVASRVPNTASFAFSNVLAPLLNKIADTGGLEQFIKQEYNFCEGIYVFNGTITNKDVGNRFDLPYQDLRLLMAAIG